MLKSFKKIWFYWSLSLNELTTNNSFEYNVVSIIRSIIAIINIGTCILISLNILLTRGWIQF